MMSCNCRTLLAKELGSKPTGIFDMWAILERNEDDHMTCPTETPIAEPSRLRVVLHEHLAQERRGLLPHKAHGPRRSRHVLHGHCSLNCDEIDGK
jgi:hypothetical protein